MGILIQKAVQGLFGAMGTLHRNIVAMMIDFLGGKNVAFGRMINAYRKVTFKFSINYKHFRLSFPKLNNNY